MHTCSFKEEPGTAFYEYPQQEKKQDPDPRPDTIHRAPAMLVHLYDL